MKRLYYHPGGIVHKEGDRLVVRCQYCGKELGPGIFAPEPCAEKTAWRTEIGGAWWEVSVWNCRANLTAWKMDEDGEDKPVFWKAPGRVREELQKLAEEAVEEAGGALNISGTYGPSEALEKAIARALESGELRIYTEPYRVVTTARFEPELLARAKAYAARRRKPLYEVIEAALRYYLNVKKA